jgi:hypothetical protein
MAVALLAASLLAACASGSRLPGGMATSDQAKQRAFIGLEEGGNYRWTVPRVVFGRLGEPHVFAGQGADPVSGGGNLVLRIGHGPTLTLGERWSARVRYVVQNWTGTAQTHDSWKSPGHAESIPRQGPAAVLVQLVGLSAGSCEELIEPAPITAGRRTGSTLIIVGCLDSFTMSGGASP